MPEILKETGKYYMAFKYDSVVPWGRSYREYLDMFSLSRADLNKKILGCGDGPAGFNAIMKQRNKPVVSVDPIYRYSRKEIEQRIEETFRDVINQTRQNRDKFVWEKIKDVDQLGRIRMMAMQDFLNDYNTGKKEKRYICAELPALPFVDDQFDLSLSSHFLFLYTDNLSYEFHLRSIDEMLRVSREVRMFPLLDVNGSRSSYADKIITAFLAKGYFVNEIKVNYEFQRNGNTMLKIKRSMI